MKKKVKNKKNNKLWLKKKQKTESNLVSFSMLNTVLCIYSAGIYDVEPVGRDAI